MVAATAPLVIFLLPVSPAGILGLSPVVRPLFAFLYSRRLLLVLLHCSRLALLFLMYSGTLLRSYVGRCRPMGVIATRLRWICAWGRLSALSLELLAYHLVARLVTVTLVAQLMLLFRPRIAIS